MPQVEDPPPHGKELVPSSDLTRARRNFLFANSLLFIAAIVPPKAWIAIPTVDSANVPMPLALTFLLGATALFLYEYLLEYRITKLRHTHATVGESSEEKSVTFENSLTRTLARLEQMDVEVRQGTVGIQTALDARWDNAPPRDAGVDERLSVQFDPFRAACLRLRDAILAELNGRAEFSDIAIQSAIDERHAHLMAAIEKEIAEVSKERAQVEALRADLNRAANSSGGLTTRLNRYSDDLAVLTANLREVSREVFDFQERAFYWKDLVLPCGFFLSAALLSSMRIIQFAPDFIADRVQWALGLGLPMILGVFAYIDRRFDKPISRRLSRFRLWRALFG